MKKYLLLLLLIPILIIPTILIMPTIFETPSPNPSVNPTMDATSQYDGGTQRWSVYVTGEDFIPNYELTDVSLLLIGFYDPGAVLNFNNIVSDGIGNVTAQEMVPYSYVLETGPYMLNVEDPVYGTLEFEVDLTFGDMPEIEYENLEIIDYYDDIKALIGEVTITSDVDRNFDFNASYYADNSTTFNTHLDYYSIDALAAQPYMYNFTIPIAVNGKPLAITEDSLLRLSVFTPYYYGIDEVYLDELP